MREINIENKFHKYSEIHFHFFDRELKKILISMAVNNNLLFKLF